MRLTTSLNRFLRLAPLMLVSICLLLSGCPDTGSVRSGAPRAGDAAARAESLQRQAAQASGSERDQLLLGASRAWLDAGQTASALNTLEQVRGALPRGDAVIDLLLAFRDVRDGRPGQAVLRLGADDGTLPRRLQPLRLELLGRSRIALGDIPAAIGHLTERERFLRGGPALDANRELLWRLLRESSRGSAPLVAADDDPLVRGWLRLSQINQRQGIGGRGLRGELEAWQAEFVNHPARSVALRLLDGTAADLAFPGQVALLLPLSGRFAATGSAIRDGFLAAHFAAASEVDTAGTMLDPLADNSTSPPLAGATGDAMGYPEVAGLAGGTISRIHVYDTETLTASGALEQALADGAEFVVGPLLKSNVAEVAALAPGVEMLALNYLSPEDPAPPGFYQLSLAPEHEASQMALEAIRNGHYNALALVPDNSFGERTLGAFANTLAANGGTLLDATTYQTSDNDFSVPIISLLNLNDSNERKRQVAAVSGFELEFKPRRRQDVQVIFMAANARQGRQIRPALRYHYAQDLPAYATASVYEADPDANGRDLDGVSFAATPWTLDPGPATAAVRDTLTRRFGTRAERLGHLYALGFDAYRVIPRLFATSTPLGTPYSGASGVLSLGASGRLERSLPVAIIDNGLAVLPGVVEGEAGELPDADAP